MGCNATRPKRGEHAANTHTHALRHSCTHIHTIGAMCSAFRKFHAPGLSKAGCLFAGRAKSLAQQDRGQGLLGALCHANGFQQLILLILSIARVMSIVVLLLLLLLVSLFFVFEDVQHQVQLEAALSCSFGSKKIK